MTAIAEWIREQVRVFYRMNPLPPRCVHCGSTRVGPKDNNVTRSATFLVDGEPIYVADLPGRRAKCHDCEVSWRHRPPGLMPRRHYQACVIAEGLSTYLFDKDATLEEVASRCCCSRWTVANWIRWVGGLSTPADLQARLVERSETVLLAPVREVAGMARKAREAGQSAMLQVAAAILCVLEALGQAMGLEPPGLRAVVEAVVDNRDRVTTYASPRIPELAQCQFGGRL